jgi:hypothetical protein
VIETGDLTKFKTSKVMRPPLQKQEKHALLRGGGSIASNKET